MSSSIAVPAGGATVGSLESHLLSLTSQQLFAALASVLSSPSASLRHPLSQLSSSRSRKRRRVQHGQPDSAAADGDSGPGQSAAVQPFTGSGEDDYSAAAAVEEAAVVLPVSAEWVRVACECCIQLCAAQQQRRQHRRRKQPQQPAAAPAAAIAATPQAQHELQNGDGECSGSPCTSYLCSLHLLLSTHCLSLTACSSLLPLTLKCYHSHPTLLRALLTATHDWSEAQLGRALKHILSGLHSSQQQQQQQQAATETTDWRPDQTLSEQQTSTQPTNDHVSDSVLIPLP